MRQARPKAQLMVVLVLVTCPVLMESGPATATPPSGAMAKAALLAAATSSHALAAGTGKAAKWLAVVGVGLVVLGGALLVALDDTRRLRRGLGYLDPRVPSRGRKGVHSANTRVAILGRVATTSNGSRTHALTLYEGLAPG